MALALISIILIIVLVLIAIRFGLNRGSIDEDEISSPVLHASGIYSIVKKSPRENIVAYKPPKEDILKYITDLNEDIEGLSLTASDKARIVDMWDNAIDENVSTIEKGDVDGIEFYYYDFVPVDCPVCKQHFSKGKFVTREEIFKFPIIIPPLHLGCTTKLLPHHGKENLRETTELGMLPLFKNQVPPQLPEWKATTKINVE
jgi:hypothetical protein